MNRFGYLTFTFGLLLGSLLLPGSIGNAQQPVDEFYSHWEDAPLRTYQAGTFAAPNSTNTYTWGAGTENNLVLDAITSTTGAYARVKLADRIVINRVDNAYHTGVVDFVWVQGTTNTATQYNFKTGFVNSEALLRSNVINRGTDNIFDNGGGRFNADGTRDTTYSGANNIERIDFIFPAGIVVTDPVKQGFTVMERNGNDAFKMAAITGLSAGVPSSFGALTTATATGWGGTGANIPLAFATDTLKDPTAANGGPLFVNGEKVLPYRETVSGQSLKGVFFSLSSLNVAAGSTIYGYSLVANDANTACLNNVTSCPTNTAGTAGAGGLDLVAGGALFETADAGDAPASYGDALHVTSSASGIYLGPAVGGEPDSEPRTQLGNDAGAGADGDDADGNDDEASVASFPTLDAVAGQTYTVLVDAVNTSGSGASLVGYLDFNGDGDFADPGEQSVTVAVPVSGSYPVVFTVPTDVVAGTTYARFRIGSAQTEVETATGSAENGEVEDYQVTIEAGLDYGDAPSSYGDASHITSGLYLGNAPDADASSQPTPDADGDDTNGADDEDGVTFSGGDLQGQAFTVDQSYTLDLATTGAGVLNAWVDFNADGDFADAGEQIATNVEPLSGAISLNVNVPFDAATGTTYARFRYSSASVGATGAASSGEVEDYTLVLSEAQNVCPTLRADLWFANDESGSVSTAEFRSSLDFLYQVSDGFIYNDTTGVKAGVTGWGSNVASAEIVIPITETFGDPGDSGLIGNGNPSGVTTNNNNRGLRELYDTKKNTSRGTRLDYATNYLADLIEDGNGRRRGVPQVAVILTDASPGQLIQTGSGGGRAWIDEADRLRNIGPNGTNILVIVTEEAAAAYNNGTAKATVDAVAGANGRVLVAPTYAEAADATNGYVQDSVQAICDLAVLEPKSLGLAKNATVDENEVTLDFYLENFSSSTLSDLSLTDDLDAVFGAGNYTVSAPSIVGSNSTLNVNTTFDGSSDQALLAAGSTLAANETAQVQVSVTVNTLSDQGDGVGVYSNTATAQAQAGGTLVDDTSTNGTDPDVDATRSDGTTADGGAGTNDNNDSPFDNREATPIILRYDYGDAPADLSSIDASMNPAYPTLKEDNGAVHTVDGVTFLGSGVTVELDGQPTLEANGDTDDGVSFPLAGSQPVLIANINQPNVITVNASTDGFLNVWIDNNQDGDFTDAGEQIFTNEALSAGNNTVNYTPTSTQPHGETYLRFRFTSASVASPSPAGALPDGEVEDYRVNIVLPQPATCEVGLTNSGFETPTASGSSIFLETNVPGWSFRASDPAATFSGVNGFTARNSIEIWRSGFSGVPAYEGDQFAEINAYVFGELYQDLVTAPGSVLTYQFAHRGRAGDDTIDVLIGEPGNVVSQTSGAGYTSPNTEWRVYTGTYTVPAGQTVTRFAFRAVSSAGGNPAAGNFLDAISFGISCDYGDAPLSYGEASHIASDLTLGATVDSEGETLLDNDDGDGADGDDLLDTDDEDGVAISTLAAGSSTDITISASEAGRLDAWIDWNGDGDFADAGEQIATNQALSAGDNTLSVAVPSTATLGATYGRFRISSAGGLTASGSAPDGEVEDYALEIVGVDLSLTKEVGNASPVAGEEVTFTLTLTNNSPDAATNVEVTDLLPSGLTFVPPSPPSTVYDETTGVWNVGTLAGDSSTTLDITATVDANGPVTLTNTAEVTATDQQDPNSTPNNRNDEPGEDDTASATLNVYRVSPSKGDIIINEVLFDQSSSSISAANNDEFIELYNAGNAPVNLSGWQLIDANLITDDENGFDGPNGNINGTVPYTFPNAQLAPGEYAIIWIGERTIERDAPSAGFQAWLGSSARLSNTGDDVWLYDAETRIVDYMAYGTNTGGKNPINPPPPASLNLWDDTYNPDLDNTEKGQSISLTPNGVDSDSSACWEPTTSGTASDGRCPNYLPTTDSDARTIDGTPLVTSVAQNNNAFEQRITGTLFYDDGLTGGVANNALQEVGEQGVPNVVVTATDGTNTVSTTTDGAGNYTLAIPDTFGSSVTLSHTQQPATGYNDGTDAVLATTYADADAASVSFTLTDNATYNFGVVRPSTLRPDQNGQVSPGGTISYTHLFTPGTLGSVNLDVAGTYTYQVFRDVDCDGIVQTSEQVDILSSGFTVDDTWPRAQDGSLAPCTLELRVFVPQGEPSGRIDLATLSAELVYANNAGITETQAVIDTTTVTAGGRLELTKQVANVTQDPTDFSSVGEGEPGDVLEYCISYQNLGTEPLTQTRFSDPVPFFTTFQTDAYGAEQDIEWTDDGTITYLSAPLDGDAGELSNDVVQVNIGGVDAGERGQVCYRVQIK